jgi:hypothetical protein
MADGSELGRCLPEDAESLKWLLLAHDAGLATLRAKTAGDQAPMAHLKLQIEKLRRQA